MALYTNKKSPQLNYSLPSIPSPPNSSCTIELPPSCSYNLYEEPSEKQPSFQLLQLLSTVQKYNPLGRQCQVCSQGPTHTS